jgi:dTDP-4-dehydrorhamnose reductase
MAPALVEVVGVGHAELDITQEDSIRRVVGSIAPDIIVNAAAYTAVDRAESEPAAAKRVNADGPRLLALAARDSDARLVHISTDFVFDGTSSTPYRPDAATGPVSEYGRTKRLGEQAVREALADRSVVLRTAWVYSPSGHNFMLTMLRLMAERKYVRVVADQVGTPTAARSVAEAIWKIISRPDINGVHHWTDAGVASWYDFAVAIAEEAADLGLLDADVTVTPIATAEYPTPARRPAYSVLDTGSLMQALGVTPAHWRKVLRTTLKGIKRA